MNDNYTKLKTYNPSEPSKGLETNYTPKRYSLGDQLLFFLKVFSIVGTVSFLLWLCGKM